jgi:hypothetical protein
MLVAMFQEHGARLRAVDDQMAPPLRVLQRCSG